MGDGFRLWAYVNDLKRIAETETVSMPVLAGLRSISFSKEIWAASGHKEQDQSEWQIEWQMALARACLGPADASLCSRSAWSGVLPAVTESNSHLW